jgi:signal peptidase II
MKVRIALLRNPFLWVTVGIFALDFATKWISGIKLQPRGSVDIIPGYLAFTYIHNTGVAFGFFNDIESAWKPYILSTIALIALAIITLFAARVPRSNTFLRSALAIIAGGIIGNFMDRLIHGYVIDFIDFHILDAFHWPAFNVADSAITIGIILMFLDSIKKSAVRSRQ